MGVSRRSFLKGSAAATAAAALPGDRISTAFGATRSSELKSGPGNKWPGRVVVNFNKDVVKGTTVDETIAKKMVDDAIMLLTGEKTVATAWKAVFPSSLSAESKIAIKTNILEPGVTCPHAATVQAITEGLLQMDIDGKTLPAGNITIYDMNNRSALSKAGYTESKFPGINLVKDKAQKHGDGALNDRAYAKTLKEADFLINVFSPRGHFITSKVTLGFKSHYGTYTTPTDGHDPFGGGPSDVSDCYLRDINCTGPVYKKTVLSMCSGMFGMDEERGPTEQSGGGPGNFVTYAKTIDPTISGSISVNTIILSTDPVSCDMQALKIQRLNKSKKYGLSDMPNYLKASAGVSGALSDATYNIGILDEEKMTVGQIINGEIIAPAVGATAKNIVPLTAAGSLSTRYLQHQGFVHIEYSVPNKLIGQEARIEIINLKGQSVFSKVQHIAGVNNHCSWNLKSSNGRTAGRGTYVVQVSTRSLKRTVSFSIV